MVKRLFDFALSSMGLIVLSPALVFIAAGIKLTSPGPMFYRGPRVGLLGRPFHILKFRTMVVDADKQGASSTASDDPRITFIGKFLRRFKLDELPQLWNVLRGEMSFVGPRPQVAWAVDLYTEQERSLLSVRPGITDYASLVFRNEGELLAGSQDPDADYLKIIAPKKIELGLYYVQNSGVSVDLKIIVATALAVCGVDPSWCLPACANFETETATLVGGTSQSTTT